MKLCDTYSVHFKAALFLFIVIPIFLTSTAFAERIAISVSKANIRSGPGKNYEVLWEVEKNHPLLVIKKQGKWYKFRDFEGDEGWIFQSLVKKISSIITKKDKCNVRSGAGTGFKVVFTAERGIPFKVLKHKGKWIYIQHADGDKGWIHKSLVW